MAKNWNFYYNIFFLIFSFLPFCLFVFLFYFNFVFIFFKFIFILFNFFCLSFCSYGKFWGGWTHPVSLPGGGRRYSSTTHSQFPPATSHLVQRWAQDSTKQPHVSTWRRRTFVLFICYIWISCLNFLCCFIFLRVLYAECFELDPFCHKGVCVCFRLYIKTLDRITPLFLIFCILKKLKPCTFCLFRHIGASLYLYFGL